MRRLQKTFLRLGLLVGFWLVWINGGNGLVFAQNPDRFQEYQVKAAFLYNFAKFVEWPKGSFPNSQAPFVLAVIGKDPFGESLDQLKGKTVGNRELLPKRAGNVDLLEQVNLLFISESEKDRLKSILRKTESAQILTVSDLKGFCEAGGHIAFYLEENKVRFEINPEAAERNG